MMMMMMMMKFACDSNSGWEVHFAALNMMPPERSADNLKYFYLTSLILIFCFSFYRAMLAQSAVMRLLSSVCPSVCNDQVP